VSTFLVQQIKLAEAIAIGSTEHVRAPRKPLAGDHRARVEALIRDRIACRPDMARLAA
jgi:4-hydroxy-tetrahydrodipicolinate synthase